MTLSDYVTAIKRGWVIILVVFLLALAGAVAVVVSRPAVYTASTQLYVASVAEEGESSESAGSMDFAGSRVASYAAVVGGDVVGDRVKDEVAGSGSETVTAAALPETVIVQVTVSGDDAERVAEVARAYARTAPSVIEDLEQDRSGQSRVRVSVFDEAEVPTSPDAVPVLPLVAGAGILGLGLGLSIVLVRETLRRERAADRRSTDDPVSTPVG